MTEPPTTTEPKSPGSLARDVAVIVLAGIALGFGHNAYLLGSGPRSGLSWVKQEQKLARLEDVLPADPAQEVAAPGPPQPVANAPVPQGGATARPSDSHAASPNPGAGKSATAPSPGDATRPAPPAATSTPVASGSGGMSLAPGTAPPPAGSPTGAVPVAAAAVPVDVPAIPETREPLETGIAVVRKLHAANAAVFVDARTAGEYAEGHIAGAVHLSFDDVFRDPDLAKKLDDRGLPIVAYCGGGDCDLSRNLAFSLIDAGHKRVLVFLDGIAGWKQAGLPVNTGTQP